MNKRIRLSVRRRGRDLIATTVFPIPADKADREVRLRAFGFELVELAYRLGEDADAIQAVIDDALRGDSDGE